MEERISDSITVVEQRLRALKADADLKHQLGDLQWLVDLLKQQRQHINDCVQKIRRYCPLFEPPSGPKDVDPRTHDVEAGQNGIGTTERAVTATTEATARRESKGQEEERKRPLMMLDQLTGERSPSDPQLSDLVHHLGEFSNDQIVEVLRDLRGQLDDTCQLLFAIQKREIIFCQRWESLFEEFVQTIDIRNTLELSVRHLSRKLDQLSRVEAHLSSSLSSSSSSSSSSAAASASSSLSPRSKSLSSMSSLLPSSSRASSSSSLLWVDAEGNEKEKESFAERLLESNERLEEATHAVRSRELKDRIDDLLDDLDEEETEDNNDELFKRKGVVPVSLVAYSSLSSSSSSSLSISSSSSPSSSPSSSSSGSGSASGTRPRKTPKPGSVPEPDEDEMIERLEGKLRTIGLTPLKTLDKDVWKQSVKELGETIDNEEREHQGLMKMMQEKSKEFTKETLLSKPHIQRLKSSIIELRQKALQLGINLDSLITQ